MSGIYKILNKSNNKCYIGSTINFNDRRNLHFSKLKRNKAYGFVWRYLKNNPGFSLSTTRKGKCIAEVNSDGNIINVWERIIDCANEIGTSSAVICDTLSEKSRRKTINNRMFKRIKKEELEQYRYLIEYDKNKR